MSFTNIWFNSTVTYHDNDNGEITKNISRWKVLRTKSKVSLNKVLFIRLPPDAQFCYQTLTYKARLIACDLKVPNWNIWPFYAFFSSLQTISHTCISAWQNNTKLNLNLWLLALFKTNFLIFCSELFYTLSNPVCHSDLKLFTLCHHTCFNLL